MTGTGFRDAILLVIGNIFLVAVAGAALWTWLTKRWSELIASLAGAVVVTGATYFPDQFLGILKWGWERFTQ